LSAAPPGPDSSQALYLGGLVREGLQDMAGAGALSLRCQAAEICLRNGQKSEARRWLLGILRLQPQHQASRDALLACEPQ
jgi:hypothetical protein